MEKKEQKDQILKSIPKNPFDASFLSLYKNHLFSATALLIVRRPSSVRQNSSERVLFPFHKRNMYVVKRDGRQETVHFDKLLLGLRNLAMDLAVTIVTLSSLLRSLLLGLLSQIFTRTLRNHFLRRRIPPDLLAVGGSTAFSRNEKLCVDNQSAKTSQNLGLSICSGYQDVQRNGSLDGTLLFFALAIIVVVLVTGLFALRYRVAKIRELDSENGDFNKADTKWKMASFHQMEVDAEEICRLDEDHVIGAGSAGKVYRVDLKKGGGTVAVKWLRRGGEEEVDGAEVSVAEMEILGKIRHRNVLKLYACLVGRGSSYLVFEFMEKGNLYQALRQNIKGGLPELDWHKRYKIAVGAAKGIAYLHHDCCPPIIHRDIKSSNILLDGDYESKIADFGVAKVADKGYEWSCVAGTHGYMAPELAYSFKATEKRDVYSFGVVLLELVTGLRPMEDEFGEGKDIVDYVYS